MGSTAESHELHGVLEIGKLVFAMQLAVLHAPSSQLRQGGGDFGVRHFFAI